jgi:sugar/nucleoside kinase (ribokinase family)
MRTRSVLVVTDGRKVARAIGPFGTVMRAASKSVRVHNPIGAGDAFCAGVMARILQARCDERVILTADFWNEALAAGHESARAHIRADR